MKSRKKRARETNVQMFGRKSDDKETSGDYALISKPLPKAHYTTSKIVSHINRELEKDFDKPPKTVSLFHLETMKKLREKALRDFFEDIDETKCPTCKRMTPIKCEHCESIFTIRMPNPQLEKNSISALLKLSDKLFPNLAAVTQDPNVSALLNAVTTFITTIVTKYVPNEEKESVIAQFRSKMVEVSDADYEVINEK